MAHTVEIKTLKELVRSLETALEEKEKSQLRLNYIATHDVLTGLWNRYAFKQKVGDYFTDKKSNAGMSLSLLLMDLTCFKEINDTLGHDIGDKVLQLVANELVVNLNDNVDIFRLGGDEFAILLIDINDKIFNHQNEILKVIGRIFKRRYKLKGNRINIGVSIGVCIAPKDACSPQELFKRADIAMYEAKRKGQLNALQYFDSNIEKEIRNKKEVEQSILDMIQEKNIDIHFQPILDAQSEIITRVEVLIRAKNNNGVDLPAAKIIQVAEESNLIVLLGDIIIERSFNFLKKLKQQTNANINLAINISPLQIRNGFIEDIESRLRDNDLSCSDITLEITESVLIDRPKFVREMLNYFHSKGVGIAIDDFGTGYSSLSYLHCYPFDGLKIDRSFISKLENNEIKQKIVSGIIQLAHAIDLKVFAEGVETEYQYDFLKAAQCDYVQGHLFYPALPADKIFEVIRSQSVRFDLNNVGNISAQNTV